MNISGVDLNLLVAFDALLSERSVTRAAQRVGLSQPAMSNALGRLRVALADPVLVRVGTTMEPTPRALELAEPIHRALHEIGRALSPVMVFDPVTSTHTFHVQCEESIEPCLLPRIIAWLKQHAPGVDVTVTPITPGAADALRTGQIDLYLGAWVDIPSPFKHHLLRQEKFSCIARIGHPQLGSGLTLDMYAKLGHVLVTPTERPGAIDRALADYGYGRRIVVRTANLLSVPLVVARTDLIATLPHGFANTFAEILPIAMYNPPMSVSKFPIHMVWHPRTDELPPYQWLRKMIMNQVGGAR